MTDEKDVKKVIDKMKFMEDEKKVKTLVKELIICAKAARKPYMPLIYAFVSTVRTFYGYLLMTSALPSSILGGELLQHSPLLSLPYVCNAPGNYSISFASMLLTAKIDLMCFQQFFLPDLHTWMNSNSRKLTGW